MTARWHTPECFPERSVDRLFTGGFVPAARHEACPGHSTVTLPDEIRGGWFCPCECHRP